MKSEGKYLLKIFVKNTDKYTRKYFFKIINVKNSFKILMSGEKMLLLLISVKKDLLYIY